MVKVVFGRQAAMTRDRGFGLFDSILGMALMALTISIFMTQLLPLVRDSGSRHHTTQALSLGEGILHRMLSVPFDHNSDPMGKIRCDQQWGATSPKCSTQLGADKGEVFAFNDVDDFSGCWTNSPSLCPTDRPAQPLDRLIDNANANFSGYRVLISVYYDHDFDGKADPPFLMEDRHTHKRIALTVDSGHGEPLAWAAYRSNY